MILITGMHRSGTSMLAGLLYKAGADFGSPENFYPADRWNPDGYFEQRDIQRINIKLLHGSWGKLSYLCLPSPQTVLSRGRRLAETLAAVSKRIENQVVKENRFCITLPAWQQAGLELEKVIICLRNPWDVAYSLKKRNRLPVAIGFKLWHDHLVRILDASEGIDRRLFLYENVVIDPPSTKEFTDILNFMGMSLEEQKAGLLLKGYVRKPERITIEDEQLPGYVEALWNQLLEEHNEQPILA